MGKIFSSGAAATVPLSRPSAKNKAPALSMGRLPEPHLGECTQEGQPSSQEQSATAAYVRRNRSSPLRKAWRVRPAPPGMPS